MQEILNGGGGKSAATATSPEYPSRGTTIDFHSAEFNYIDDLNDNSGNCRSFETLDGIVTADMRHQMERRQKKTDDNSTACKITPSGNIERQNEETASIEDAPPLTIISYGRTLIVGPDARQASLCACLLEEKGLTCTILVVKDSQTGNSFSMQDAIAPRKVNSVSITGAFGGFAAQVTVKGSEERLSVRCEEKPAVFDLIFDLQSNPSYAGQCLPAGYYAPGAKQADIDEVLAQLPSLRGKFEKPQFIFFSEKQCIHGRSRTKDCRECLTICPVGAIQSADRKISVNHYLCQGCGACALVCRADAIRMIHPSAEEILARLENTLTNRTGVDRPSILFINATETPGYDNKTDNERSNDISVHFPVEQSGHIGLGLLAASLAYGASRVVVVCADQEPKDIVGAVERQTDMARAVLEGLNLSGGKTPFAKDLPGSSDTSKLKCMMIGFDAHPLPAQAFSLRKGNRAIVRQAVQHLYDQSGVQERGISLPDGSPFGAVAVNSAACTLCMACAVVCPTGAMSAAGLVPRLEFIESRCHQCGLCQEACPEKAIRLLPRIYCDPEAVENPVVLCEAEPFRCVECGVPFATKGMIDRLRDKLRGHWMYTESRQLRRLQMCRICRTRDALQSQDIKSWNQ